MRNSGIGIGLAVGLGLGVAIGMSLQPGSLSLKLPSTGGLRAIAQSGTPQLSDTPLVVSGIRRVWTFHNRGMDERTVRGYYTVPSPRRLAELGETSPAVADLGNRIMQSETLESWPPRRDLEVVAQGDPAMATLLAEIDQLNSGAVWNNSPPSRAPWAEPAD